MCWDLFIFVWRRPEIAFTNNHDHFLNVFSSHPAMDVWTSSISYTLRNRRPQSRWKGWTPLGISLKGSNKSNKSAQMHGTVPKRARNLLSSFFARLFLSLFIISLPHCRNISAGMLIVKLAMCVHRVCQNKCKRIVLTDTMNRHSTKQKRNRNTVHDARFTIIIIPIVDWCACCGEEVSSEKILLFIFCSWYSVGGKTVLKLHTYGAWLRQILTSSKLVVSTAMFLFQRHSTYAFPVEEATWYPPCIVSD